MWRRPHPFFVALAIAGAALVQVSCGGDDGGSELGDVETLSNPACEDAEYGGEDEAQGLIVSDLPMQGDSAQRSEQQVEAIRLVLENNDWKAGAINVALQVCDDSTEETGLWSPRQCRENAQSYAENPDVLGVIGTYNSGCAAIEIPILNRAGVAMVSPGNTNVCLTQQSSSCETGQPASLYSSGARNYARVVPNDAFQGAALVEFAQRRGVERPFVLYAAKDPTSTGQAENFQGAAAGAGLPLVGFETWDPDAADYTGLFEKVAASEADAVVLAGLTEQNGARLIEDKVAGVGSNQEVPLIAFDGFAQQATIDEAGEAAGGMYASVPGRAPQNLSGRGENLVDQLQSAFPGEVELYAPYAGEAAKVMLEAIEAAGAEGFEPGGERSRIAAKLLQTRRPRSGILGAYRIGPNGDPSIGPVTIFAADGRFRVETEIVPERALVDAARGLG